MDNIASRCILLLAEAKAHPRIIHRTRQHLRLPGSRLPRQDQPQLRRRRGLRHRNPRRPPQRTPHRRRHRPRRPNRSSQPSSPTRPPAPPATNPPETLTRDSRRRHRPRLHYAHRQHTRRLPRIALRRPHRHHRLQPHLPRVALRRPRPPLPHLGPRRRLQPRRSPLEQASPA